MSKNYANDNQNDYKSNSRSYNQGAQPINLHLYAGDIISLENFPPSVCTVTHKVYELYSEKQKISTNIVTQPIKKYLRFKFMQENLQDD